MSGPEEIGVGTSQPRMAKSAIGEAADGGMVERVALAIEAASAQRVYGLYDYSGYPGDAPPHVVRAERTDIVVFRSEDPEAARAVYERLARAYVARAAIKAMREPTPAMMAEAMNVDGPLSRGQLSAVEVWDGMIDAALGKPA